MNKKTTATGVIMAALLSGAVMIGSEANKPECDYVITDTDICLTELQAEALLKQFKAPTAGLGGIKLGGEVPMIIAK